jgi:Uma2 family endonuclease
MAVAIARRLFNVAEYYRMAEAGIFSEDDRVELIEGEIAQMTPIGSGHAGRVLRIGTLFSRQVGDAALVNVQNPIRLGDFSEPQPDVALLRPRDDFYAQGHPTPADVLLLIEVADTSLAYDRGVKAPLYARARIPELWIVNLLEDLIEVYTDPVDGAYRQVRRARRGETLSMHSPPGVALSVAAILG